MLGCLHFSFLGSWVRWGRGALSACGFHRPGLSDLVPGGSCKQVNGQSKKSGNSPTFSTEEPCGAGACICEASLRTSCKLYLQTILDCLPRAQVKVYSKAIPSGRVWSWPTACIRSPAFRFDCLSECDTFRLRKNLMWLQRSSVATILTILQLKLQLL